MKNRIDKELVERQLITSRTRAQELIESGYVKCNDKIIYKCNYLVSESDKLEIIKNDYKIIIDKIKKETLINYSVAVMAEVAERAKQEDAPIYEGDKEVDQWVRLSDVEDAINKYLNLEFKGENKLCMK